MYDSKPYYYGTGRRKHSVARVRMYPGTGKITINGRDIDEYFGLETLKLIVRQPMEITNTRAVLISFAPLQAVAFPARPGAIRHGVAVPCSRTAMRCARS